MDSLYLAVLVVFLLVIILMKHAWAEFVFEDLLLDTSQSFFRDTIADW